MNIKIGDLLEESLFGFLKDVYIDEVIPELEDMKEELQWEFEETFIVFGDGPEIPTAMWECSLNFSYL